MKPSKQQTTLFDVVGTKHVNKKKYAKGVKLDITDRSNLPMSERGLNGCWKKFGENEFKNKLL